MKIALWLHRHLTNQRLHWLLLILFFLFMVSMLIPPIANIILMVAVGTSSMSGGYFFAKWIDWLDAQVEIEVWLRPMWHAVYALCASAIIGTILGSLGIKALPYSQSLYLILDPRVAYFLAGLVLSVIGYYLAWRKFPKRLRPTTNRGVR